MLTVIQSRVSPFEAVRTGSPEDDLGFVDLIAVVVAGVKARALAADTVDVLGPAAIAADQVVMVVAGAGFVAGGVPGRFDSAKKPSLGESMEHVVDRLLGHGAQAVADSGCELVGSSVRMSDKPIENS